MIATYLKTARPHARHVLHAGLCLVAILFGAATASAESIDVGSYYSWQWNGFFRSQPPSGTGNGSLADLNSSTDTSSTSSTVSSTTTSSLSALSSSCAALDFGGTASLSGYVYLDVNPDDGGMKATDWAIYGAKLALTLEGAPSPLTTTKTDLNGYYYFGLWPAGNYSITLLTPSSSPGLITVGQLRNTIGELVTTGRGTAVTNGITNITLGNGYTGVNYSFAQLTYPAGLISKRMVLSNSPDPIHTIPEPSSLLMLVAAGLAAAGGLVWRRWNP